MYNITLEVKIICWLVVGWHFHIHLVIIFITGANGGGSDTMQSVLSETCGMYDIDILSKKFNDKGNPLYQGEMLFQLFSSLYSTLYMLDNC